MVIKNFSARQQEVKAFSFISFQKQPVTVPSCRHVDRGQSVGVSSLVSLRGKDEATCLVPGRHRGPTPGKRICRGSGASSYKVASVFTIFSTQRPWGTSPRVHLGGVLL